MSWNVARQPWFMAGIAAMSLAVVSIALAQEADTRAEVDAINEQISEKQSTIDQLNRQIDSYQQKIDQAQARETSLHNQMEILENRIAKSQLDIEASEASIDLVNSEIASIDQEISLVQEAYERDRGFIEDVLREMQSQDHQLPLLLLFGSNSFAELFDTLQQLENVSSELKTAVDRAKSTKERLIVQKNAQSVKKDQLVALQTSLKRDKIVFEEEVEAKTALVAEARDSEARFQELLRERQEEQNFINYQVTLLQQELEDRLRQSDQAGESTVVSWPFDPSRRGISTYFRDPTYPFRNLFEHSGLDLPAATGTPVGSAAPGYVAWTKVGRLYGNYVMVIHTNGLATLYAHLSRIDVVPDQFVARGETVGAVGSTGFSTGPHLHFETRLNGIPTDPLNYLPSF